MKNTVEQITPINAVSNSWKSKRMSAREISYTGMHRGVFVKIIAHRMNSHRKAYTTHIIPMSSDQGKITLSGDCSEREAEAHIERIISMLERFHEQ